MKYLLTLLFVIGSFSVFAYDGEGVISEEELLAAEGITESSPEYASREPAIPSEIEKQEAIESEPSPEETEWNFPDSETEALY